MKVMIKYKESKLFKKLISESLHSACSKYQKKRKLSQGQVDILESNLKLELQNGSYIVEPPDIYFHREKGKDTKFAKYHIQDEIVVSALYEVLAPVVNERLLKQCIGGRKGYSRHSFLGYLELTKKVKTFI
jgi:hypothetical protein